MKVLHQGVKLCQNEHIHILVREFGAKQVHLDAASEGDDGTVSVDAYEVIFEKGYSHPFFKYIKYADFLNFSEIPDSLLRVTFGVNDLVVGEE